MVGNRLDAETFFTDFVFNGRFIATGEIVRIYRVFEAPEPWFAGTDLTPESRLRICGPRGREAYSWSGDSTVLAAGSLAGRIQEPDSGLAWPERDRSWELVNKPMETSPRCPGRARKRHDRCVRITNGYVSDNWR